MKRRTAARLAWSVGGLTMAAIIAGVVIQLVTPSSKLPPSLDTSPADVVDNLTILLLPAIGALVASRRPDISLGWLFLLAGLGLGLSNFGSAYAAYGLVVSPGSLPGARVAGWLQVWTWTLGVGAIPFLFLLFPTGRLNSRRWRPVAWFAVACWIFMAGSAFIAAFFLWSNPLIQDTKDWPAAAKPLGTLLGFSFFAILAAIVLGLISAVVRFKGSRGEERQQLKWFVTAAAFFVAVLLSQIFFENVVTTALITLASVALFGGIAVAILKYRLYDIDIVINKAVVFGALAAFFTGVYVAVVVGIGALVGSRANTLLTVIAAVLIAVAFQPVRERARHLANRLVYGKRATPYEVLSEFSERMTAAYATEDLPERMARILADGTGATRATVWVAVGGELRPAASWPADGESPRQSIRLDGHDIAAPPEANAFLPVRYQDEVLGALSVQKPPSEPVTPAEEKLVADLASQAGLVLRNVRLIEELRASRQRLVKAQDEERRRLERNIHDGAQQQLVALSVKLTLVRAMSRKDPERADSMLGDLQAEAQDAMENLRDLARGIYPPLLADHGLVAALEAQARKAAIAVQIESDGISRYPQEAEAAVYFCALEALQNVAKYAGTDRAVVRLREEGHSLVFEIVDHGVGFDPKDRGFGTGLQGMADRLAALGGQLSVESSPGQGSTVRGAIPVGAGASRPVSPSSV
jgi:signal transduction histidine kinase